MNHTVEFVLLLSILLNLLLIGAGIFFVIRKGGVSYLLRNIFSLKKAESNLKSLYERLEYWDRISQFENLPSSDSAKIFLGDSLTAYCEWAELFKDSHIKNRGIAGDITEGVLNRIDQIVETKPRKLLLMIGINDLIQGEEISRIVDSYRSILIKVQDKAPNTEVVVQSVLPINNEKSIDKLNKKLNNKKVIELNESLQRLVQEFSLDYRDLFSDFSDSQGELNTRYTSDGVHLNGSGYLLWKEIIEKDIVD